MILAADIGNSSVKVGLMEEGRCVASARTPSGPDPRAAAETLWRQLEAFRAAHGPASAAIVSSVVPDLTAPAEEVLAAMTGSAPLRLTHDTPLPVRNGYARPREAGLDRLAGAVGGMVLCGAPVIVVDAGTAVTVDVVSGDAVFLGGAILPGAELWSHALHDHTAALPCVAPEAPERVIGTTTVENIQSGIVHGLAGAVDRLVELARAELRHAEAPALLTGGAASLLAGRCRTIDRVEEHLVLMGLERILRGAS